MQTKPLKKIDFAKSFDIFAIESAVSAVRSHQINVELPEGTQSAFVNLDFGEDIILSSVDLVTLSQK